MIFQPVLIQRILIGFEDILKILLLHTTYSLYKSYRMCLQPKISLIAGLNYEDRKIEIQTSCYNLYQSFIKKKLQVNLQIVKKILQQLFITSFYGQLYGDSKIKNITLILVLFSPKTQNSVQQIWDYHFNFRGIYSGLKYWFKSYKFSY